MARKCEMCGKGSHSANHVARRGLGQYVLARSKRVHKPNIQKKCVMININGQYKQMRLCTRCLRTLTHIART
ncbi:MAG: 50S ribosomal protein L28 [Firmicutes bacterium]|nr:50S ribosomal protein L28 [Bacillota bacterium]